MFPLATNFKILEIHDISTPQHATDTNNNKNSTQMLLITDGKDKYRALERERLNLTLKSTLVLQNVISKNNILLLTKENTW